MFFRRHDFMIQKIIFGLSRVFFVENFDFRFFKKYFFSMQGDSGGPLIMINDDDEISVVHNIQLEH